MSKLLHKVNTVFKKEQIYVQSTHTYTPSYTPVCAYVSSTERVNLYMQEGASLSPRENSTLYVGGWCCKANLISSGLQIQGAMEEAEICQMRQQDDGDFVAAESKHFRLAGAGE